MTYVLTLRRTGLSPVTRCHAGFLVAYWSDPEVQRFLFDASTAVPSETRKLLMPVPIVSQPSAMASG